MNASYTLPKGCVLVVRCCTEKLTSYNEFQWPESGPVKAPDWLPTAACGHGLHGWLWGQGKYDAAVETRNDPQAKWLVVEVAEKDIIQVTDSGGGKVKYPGGVVVFCGFWWDAFAMARQHRPRPAKFESINTGDYGHAAATGDYGHAAATGYSAHAAATGDYGHAAATGNSAHAAATGDYGHAAATGNSGHAAATGDSGHAAATGYYGHAAATGDYGHAAATGYSGHAAATGYYGIACALGRYGIVTAGETGTIIGTYRDGDASRWRVVVGYVGEDGIKPHTAYRVKDGKFVEVLA